MGLDGSSGRVGVLWVLAAVLGIAGPGAGAASPHTFVCTSQTVYRLRPDGTLGIISDPTLVRASIGTFTVDARTGIIQGDVLPTDMKWKVVHSGNGTTAAKLIATDPEDFFALTIQSDVPDSQIYSTFPFAYLQGATGQVITGYCRGAH